MENKRQDINQRKYKMKINEKRVDNPSQTIKNEIMLIKKNVFLENRFVY